MQFTKFILPALAFTWTTCWIHAGANADSPGDSRPNIILMLVDDLGYECLGANGSRTFAGKTPAVDQLAAAGMRFENAFVQPNCTPTRVALMTGKVNARNYVHFGLLEDTNKTFGNLFRDAGYNTCVVGKWQLGGSVEENTPGHFGFDQYCLYHIPGTPKSKPDESGYMSRYINPGLVINGVGKVYENNEYAPDICNDFVVDYLNSHARMDQPFFIYYPMMLTHGPFDPTPDSSDYPGKNGPERTRFEHYQDMVAYNDKLIGRMVDALDELGIRENTLILFVGDNGSPGNWEFEMLDGSTITSGKGGMTRAGIRVPLVANRPGYIPQGSVCDDLINVTDFLPTICDAAGIDLPADFVHDGVSFLPQLTGNQGNPREWIYSWWCPLMDKPQPTYEIAFTREYKLHKSGEFYDWRTDPEEAHPLQVSSLTGEAATVAVMLQGVLDQYSAARPVDVEERAVSLRRYKPEKKK